MILYRRKSAISEANQAKKKSVLVTNSKAEDTSFDKHWINASSTKQTNIVALFSKGIKPAISGDSRLFTAINATKEE